MMKFFGRPVKANADAVRSTQNAPRADEYFVEVQDSNTEYLSHSETMLRKSEEVTEKAKKRNSVPTPMAFDSDANEDINNQQPQQQQQQQQQLINPHEIEMDIETFQKHQADTAGTEDNDNTKITPCWQTRTLYIAGSVLIVVILVLSISLSLTLSINNNNDSNSNSDSTGETSTLPPTENNDDSNATMTPEQASNYVLQSLNFPTPQEIASVLSTSVTTPQSQAFSTLVAAEQSAATVTSPFRIQQRYALAVLYFSTSTLSVANDEDDKNTWTDSTGWSTFAADECQWKGSICNSENANEAATVTELDLAMNNLVGTIPTELCRLSNNLVSIDFSGNFMYGRIPECFTLFESMQRLVVFNNSLTGTLPPFGLASLSDLDVRYNQMTGTLDAMFDALSLMSQGQEEEDPDVALSMLRLDRNQFSGSIPKLTPAPALLTKFTFTENNLTGSVSFCDEMENYPMLELIEADCSKVNCTCCNNCNVIFCFSGDC